MGGRRGRNGGAILGLLESGFEAGSVYIVDPAVEEVTLARSHGFQVLDQIAERPEGGTDQRFGLVLCLQTIDHVLDLAKGLANFNAALHSGGLAALTVTDRSLAAVMIRGKRCGDLQIDHTYYFNRRCVHRLAELWGIPGRSARNIHPANIACVLRKTAGPSPVKNECQV